MILSFSTHLPFLKCRSRALCVRLHVWMCRDVYMCTYTHASAHTPFMFASVCSDLSLSSSARWEHSPPNRSFCMETMSTSNGGQMKETTICDWYERVMLVWFKYSLFSNVFLLLKELPLCTRDSVSRVFVGTWFWWSHSKRNISW